MQRFRHILYVSHGIHSENDGLKQALTLAHANDAVLRVLVIYPAFPKSHQEYIAVYEDAMRQRIQHAVALQQQALQRPVLPIPVDVVGGQALSAMIVQRVQLGGYDLVIKEAELRADQAGLLAIDMELLRQSPAPVWLSRPVGPPRENIKVAVAIDPVTELAVEQGLVTTLLQLANSLALSCSGELEVVACWDYEFEDFLRNSVWSKVSEEELVRIVRDVEVQTQAAVAAAVKLAGISARLNVVLKRGDPSQLIPLVVKENKVDILVMGTLARAGIAGYMIGNTAENVAQQVTCSLLAVKPPAGF